MDEGYTELKPGDVAPFDKGALMWSGHRYLSEAKTITLTDGTKVSCRIFYGSFIPGTDGKGGSYTVYVKDRLKPVTYYKKNKTSGGNKKRRRRATRSTRSTRRRR